MVTITAQSDAVDVRDAGLPFPVPGDDAFGGEDATGFLAATELRAVGSRLVETCEELRHLANAEVAYLWKRTGGKAQGKRTFAACRRPTGLLAYFGKVDFVVWVAADHGRDEAFTRGQMEALVFHELMHASFETDKKSGEIRWTIRGHDWAGFRGEARRYGRWTPESESMAEAFRQAPLF